MRPGFVHQTGSSPAFLVGAVVPFGMLLVKAIRRGLRIAGSLILFGSALHIVWLLVPEFEAQAGVMLVAGAGVAVLLVVSLLTGSGLTTLLEVRRAQ